MTIVHIERIMTLHPEGKQGVNIERAKYDVMRRALLKVIPHRAGGIPFKDLNTLVKPYLDSEAYGPRASVSWYVVTVKQDLEARGLIEKVPGACPQHIRRAKGGPR